MTATNLDFAKKLGELLNVPRVACQPKPGGEFIYPTGDRDKLSAADNYIPLNRFQRGWAIMARTGGSVAVVDVDPRNGSDIDKTKQLLDSLNVRIFAEVATPSGGRHFYIAGHPKAQHIQPRRLVRHRHLVVRQTRILARHPTPQIQRRRLSSHL
jgi:hypothetical protein